MVHTLDIKAFKNLLLHSDEMGKFPEYPSDEEGGSAVIFDPELQAQYRGEMIGRADSDDSEEDEEGGGKKDKKKDEKAGADTKKADADKKGAKEEEEDTHGFKLGRSEFVKGLREADREFHGEFQLKGGSRKVVYMLHVLYIYC